MPINIPHNLISYDIQKITAEFARTDHIIMDHNPITSGYEYLKYKIHLKQTFSLNTKNGFLPS
jgi:hypothetical protein